MGRTFSHAIIHFLFFFSGSLWITGILTKKYIKIILLFLVTNSLFFYLSALNNYFSIGYLLNFILFKKLISENEEKVADLGLSFKNWRRNVTIGIVVGILFSTYEFFILSLTQGYEFNILQIDRYSEIIIGTFILIVFYCTFFIGFFFHYLFKKGINTFISIIIIAFLYNVFQFGYTESIRDIQYVIGTIFFMTISTFVYCGVFLLCRNIVPIAIIYAMISVVAFSFGIVK